MIWKTEYPYRNTIMESEFIDYLNYVLLDYDDESCQAQLHKMMAQIEADKTKNIRPSEQKAA